MLCYRNSRSFLFTCFGAKRLHRRGLTERPRSNNGARMANATLEMVEAASRKELNLAFVISEDPQLLISLDSRAYLAGKMQLVPVDIQGSRHTFFTPGRCFLEEASITHLQLSSSLFLYPRALEL